MALRAGHGSGAGQPRIEVLPADELPRGVQGLALADHKSERRPDGTFKPGARTAQSAGGNASKDKPGLARRLALGEAFADPRFEEYARAAKAFRKAKVCDLARGVGGGHCGAGPASIVASASLQLAASRYAFEILGDMVMGSKLANDSRQNLLAAHELCAKEAQARPKADPLGWLTNPAPTAPKALPTVDASDDKPPAEGNVVPPSDKVEGFANEGAP